MYEDRSELSKVGSGGTGVSRPHGRNTGMDNDIFILPLLEVMELKSYWKIFRFKFIVKDLHEILTSNDSGGLAVIWLYVQIYNTSPQLNVFHGVDQLL